MGRQDTVCRLARLFEESPPPETRPSCTVFTYAAGVYSPAGRTIINNVRSESLVIDKDSTGQLWATWVQGASGNRKVWVNRTTTGTTWGTPSELPVNGTSVADDDISSIVAFRDGAKPSIGVFWSNQKGSSFHFAVRDDAAADTTGSRPSRSTPDRATPTTTSTSSRSSRTAVAGSSPW